MTTSMWNNLRDRKKSSKMITLSKSVTKPSNQDFTEIKKIKFENNSFKIDGVVDRSFNMSKFVKDYTEFLRSEDQYDKGIMKNDNDKTNAAIDSIRNDNSYGIYKDGNILSFIRLNKKEDIMWVSVLYTASDSQRKGYGRKLLEFSNKMAYDKKCNTLSLLVFADNENAISLYKKIGFR